MLGIILIIFIGKYFYELAQDYYKHRWLYAILGIVVYYAGTGVGGVVLGVMNELFGLNINWDNTLLMTFIALPFGIGASGLFYFLLRRNWKKAKIEIKDEIQDIGRNPEENI
ncbi:hypothetical protein [Seonamhaeicola sp.]|uniref:hypothetical protein n=1 Tax=Seonamhaeicola sp. TaxID=1912245 RepID=UPI002615DCA2|nr:hypothetical protein [Seonamhaeicola sp.]